MIDFYYLIKKDIVAKPIALKFLSQTVRNLEKSGFDLNPV